MKHYLNDFTATPQTELFIVTYDSVEIGTEVQVALKKGDPVLKPVKVIIEQREARGQYKKKNTPNYYHVTV